MRTHLLFVLSFLITAGLSYGQIEFSDDFESYEAGDYVGNVSNDWTTWSGNTGTNEDAQISEAQAASGTKSLYFPGTASGPQDVVLPFGAKHTSGQFTYSMKMWVVEGTAAYFNFQGETTIGQTWTSSVYLRTTGNMEIDDESNTTVIATTYPVGEWFEISFDINLTENVWRAYMNGNCIGSYANTFDGIASIDIFPLNQETGISEFYIDDVSYSHNPVANVEAPIETDAALTINTDLLLGLSGRELSAIGYLDNTGLVMVNDADISVNIGTETIDLSLTGLALMPGERAEVVLDSPVIVGEGSSGVSLSLEGVNGGEDDEACNDFTAGTLRGVVRAPNKGVLVEEGTGTWCVWCPRGAVFMEAMSEKYGDMFVGVAVHNSVPTVPDPMLVAEYDAGLTGNSIYDFTGFPSVVVERQDVMDPSGVEGPFLNRISVMPRASMKVGALLNETSREMDVSIEVTAMQDLFFADNLALILVEDNVTGTDSGYAQANAYAGGGSGVMGGYELLPSPVPAADMVYDDVARAVINGYAGSDIGIASILSSGETILHNYRYTIPEEFDLTELSLVSVYLNSNGTADNAIEVSLEEAILNGFLLNSVNDLQLQAGFEIYPNPTADLMNVKLESLESGEVQLEILNLYGQVIQSESLTAFVGQQNWIIEVQDLPNGIYSVRVNINGKAAVQKLQKFSR